MTILQIGNKRLCDCKEGTLNCLSAGEWLKTQVGIWQFSYSSRDIRDKWVHPATFPISLAQQVIKLFTHKGELVIDPFVGSGTTLMAAQTLDRNAIGFDLKKKYVELAQSRMADNPSLFNRCQQVAINDDARNIAQYVAPETASLIWTSPPYANCLDRERTNKSRRDRTTAKRKFNKNEQYSQDERDLGTMGIEPYTKAMGDIFAGLLPLLRHNGHCVINVPDIWWENKRVTIHVSVIEELRSRGYELRNIIIWDRTNIVNQIGIFGWPSNYITAGVTYEYILDFWKP